MLFWLIAALLIFLPLINLAIAFAWQSSKNEITKVGHRGAGGLAPENTVVSVLEGIHYDMEYIEVDVRATQDGELIIMHDRSVNRTTDGQGFVHQLTIDQISRLNVSMSFTEHKAPIKVPLLREVLAVIKTSNSKLLIEIKDPHLYPTLLSRLRAELIYADATGQVAIFSFSQALIQQVKKQIPEVQTGLFCLAFDFGAKDVVYTCPNWLSILYFPFIVSLVHKRGKKIWVWTPDNKFFMRYLLKMKVDGIITDRPDKLVSILSPR